MGFKDILGKAYPFISAAASIGGPPAVIVASMVGKAFGLDKVEASHVGISDAIAQAQAVDPEAFLKLKQIENDFTIKMKEIGINSAEALLAADNADRADARAREVAVKDHTNKILAFVVVGITLLFEGIILWHGLPKDIDGVVVGRVMGTMDSALIMVLAYYFGSSAGSDAKNKMISSQLSKE